MILPAAGGAFGSPMNDDNGEVKRCDTNKDCGGGDGYCDQSQNICCQKPGIWNITIYTYKCNIHFKIPIVLEEQEHQRIPSAAIQILKILAATTNIASSILVQKYQLKILPI